MKVLIKFGILVDNSKSLNYGVYGSPELISLSGLVVPSAKYICSIFKYSYSKRGIFIYFISCPYSDNILTASFTTRLWLGEHDTVYKSVM